MEDFMREGFDWRRFLLLNRKRCALVCLTAVIGGLLCGGVYLLWTRVINAQEIYQSRVLYAITFDQDQVGDIHDFYNDYTWNDILDTDQIAGEAAQLLEGITQEEIAEAANIPTMSDIKYIWVEVNWENPETAERIQGALGTSLIAFADRTDGFTKIEVWDQPPTERINGANYFTRVFGAGVVTTGIFGVLWICYQSAMDDSVYSQKDLEQRLGILPAGSLLNGNNKKVIPKIEERELCSLRRNLAALKECKCIGVTSIGTKLEQGDRTLQLLKQCLMEYQEIQVVEYQNNEKYYEELRKLDGFILMIAAGKQTGAYLLKEWKNFEYQKCVPSAVVLYDIDRAFYYAYYYRNRTKKATQ